MRQEYSLGKVCDVILLYLGSANTARSLAAKVTARLDRVFFSRWCFVLLTGFKSGRCCCRNEEVDDGPGIKGHPTTGLGARSSLTIGNCAGTVLEKCGDATMHTGIPDCKSEFTLALWSMNSLHFCIYNGTVHCRTTAYEKVRLPFLCMTASCGSVRMPQEVAVAAFAYIVQPCWSLTHKKNSFDQPCHHVHISMGICMNVGSVLGGVQPYNHFLENAKTVASCDHSCFPVQRRVKIHRSFLRYLKLCVHLAKMAPKSVNI